jgi:hypothetical protein
MSCLCHLEDPPPIPKETFFHLSTSNRPHNTPFWLHGLPKKLKTSIHPGPHASNVGAVSIGYNVLIIEGPDTMKVIWMLILIVVIGILVTVICGGATGDLQGATVGGLVAAGLVLLLMVFQQLSPQVIDVD